MRTRDKDLQSAEIREALQKRSPLEMGQGAVQGKRVLDTCPFPGCTLTELSRLFLEGRDHVFFIQLCVSTTQHSAQHLQKKCKKHRFLHSTSGKFSVELWSNRTLGGSEPPQGLGNHCLEGRAHRLASFRTLGPRSPAATPKDCGGWTVGFQHLTRSKFTLIVTSRFLLKKPRLQEAGLMSNQTGKVQGCFSHAGRESDPGLLLPRSLSFGPCGP